VLSKMCEPMWLEVSGTGENSIKETFVKYYWVDEIKKHRMGGVCNAN
jgi:hypothetical protein